MVKEAHAEEVNEAEPSRIGKIWRGGVWMYRERFDRKGDNGKIQIRITVNELDLLEGE